jgi:hypothetical protein
MRIKGSLVVTIAMTILIIISTVIGFLAFNGHTMDLRLAFFSIMGLLLVVAMQGLR